MDIEQLKLVLDAVGAVSDNASSVAIWWFAFDFVKYLIGGAVITGAVYFVTNMMIKINSDDHEEFIVEMRSTLFPTISGRLTGNESIKVKNVIRELVRNR